MRPHTQFRLACACLAISVALWPLAHATGWIRSVVFVNELSLAAIVLAAVIWVASSHLEVQRDEEDVAREVVQAMVDDPRLPGEPDG